MGLDITVMIVDWKWLRDAPRPERLSRLRDAWYADETGLWNHDRPGVNGDWEWPRGPDGGHFAVYEFRDTLGSFKAHFWAGQRWEQVRDRADPSLRTSLDALLLGLIWQGLDGEAEHVDPGFFSEDPRISYGMLVARTPESVRGLATLWEEARPAMGGLREAFERHAAVADGWVGRFDAFVSLLEEWSHVLAAAAQRGWGVVGLSE
ncbi:hypothetical protein [Streptomyces sp. NPDC007172]|uniref:hypothetical protein n=1 Tax=unclassified Streptomyces TaxID=2593676 RepID=UPI0036CF18A5